MRTKASTLGLLFLTSGLLLWLASLALAKDFHVVEVAQESSSVQTSTEDENYCLVCHEGSDQTFQLADGSVHSVAVDLEVLAGSVHGEGNSEGALACADCHEGVTFPHMNSLPEAERVYTVSKSINCTGCHTEQIENLADSVHYSALVNGNFRAASCVDCHGGHDVQPATVSRVQSVESCGTCHTTTFDEYKDSVHGESLFAGDENVPTCTDCHGVHGIQHPTTALFRNRSPELCATCHADSDLMRQYDISTNVFDSYVTDFHGTTVSLFDQADPNVPTNKAVCYDCHGVHNITRADDTKSQVARSNLLETCQQCHPTATSDFPESWVGHFEPTLDRYPLLFAVRWFYLLVIPITLGVFGLLIGTDIFRWLRELFGKRGN